MPQRKTGDGQLARAAYFQGLKPSQRSKVNAASSESKLGRRTQDRLFGMAARGDLGFDDLVGTLRGKKIVTSRGAVQG